VKERRIFPREQADWLAEIYTDDTIYTAPVRNLSLGGVELFRPQLWRPKPENFFKISLTDMTPSNTLDLKMEVCWVSDVSIGLKYHGMEMGQKIKLNKILSNMSREAVLENNHLVIMQ